MWGLYLLQFLFGWSLSDINKYTDLLTEAVKGKEDAIEELSKCIGVSEKDVKNVVTELKDTFTKQAMSRGNS